MLLLAYKQWVMTIKVQYSIESDALVWVICDNMLIDFEQDGRRNDIS